MPEYVSVLIVVDSWQGHTRKVAERLIEGVQPAGAVAQMKTADEATRADLLAHQALVLGSAVHQRNMTWKMKRFIDEVCEPAWFFDDIVGRVGAVFTAGGGHGQAGGGAEMTQLGLLANLAACGMILVTLPKCTPGFEHAGMHWGPTIKATTDDMQPVDPDAMDHEALEAFFHHGVNIALVTQRLHGITLAAGNRWPSPKEREARARIESGRPLNARFPHAADPTAHA